MWVLLRPPQFGRAKHASDHDNRSRHRQVFQVHGVAAQGEVVIRRQLKRRYVLAFFQMLPLCLVGIETSASSHHWSRELKALGHTVRLMPPAFVKPCRAEINSGSDGDPLKLRCAYVLAKQTLGKSRTSSGNALLCVRVCSATSRATSSNMPSPRRYSMSRCACGVQPRRCAYPRSNCENRRALHRSHDRHDLTCQNPLRLRSIFFIRNRRDIEYIS